MGSWPQRCGSPQHRVYCTVWMTDLFACLESKTVENLHPNFVLGEIQFRKSLETVPLKEARYFAVTNLKNPPPTLSFPHKNVYRVENAMERGGKIPKMCTKRPLVKKFLSTPTVRGGGGGGLLAVFLQTSSDKCFPPSFPFLVVKWRNQDFLQFFPLVKLQMRVMQQHTKCSSWLRRKLHANVVISHYFAHYVCADLRGAVSRDWFGFWWHG